MIEILLLEKNLILSAYLSETLSQEKEFNVISICKEGIEIIEFLKNHSVNIILMDYMQTNGLVVVNQITKEFPKVKVIGFSTDNEDNINNRFLALGGYCYLSKYCTDLNRLKEKIKECYMEKYIN
ncbi:MAG: response regulator [Flavobacteriales bacterium]|nr:response regulator [Flavobacteriales bacterium]